MVGVRVGTEMEPAVTKRQAASSMNTTRGLAGASLKGDFQQMNVMPLW
jgi:hypothetical protein